MTVLICLPSFLGFRLLTRVSGSFSATFVARSRVRDCLVQAVLAVSHGFQPCYQGLLQADVAQ